MWAKALGKAQQRATEWTQKHPGMMFTILAHNQYIASVLSYIGQLVPPSNEVVRSFEKIVCKLLTGPGNWITPTIARNLQLLGFRCQLVDPEVISQASMLRYYCQTSLQIDDLGVEMFMHLQAYTKSDYQQEVFLKWHRSAFTLNLLCNVATCKQSGVTVGRPRFQGEDGWKPKPGLQKLLVKSIQATKYTKASVIDSLRKRLIRWRLDLNL